MILTVLADGVTQTGEATAANPLSMMLPFIIMIAVFYFMLIRPQKKREKEAKMMLGSLKVGDKIVTIGGIYGKITQLKEDTLIIETGAINDKGTIKIARSAVKEVTSKDTSNEKIEVAEEKEDNKKEKKNKK